MKRKRTGLKKALWIATENLLSPPLAAAATAPNTTTAATAAGLGTATNSTPRRLVWSEGALEAMVAAQDTFVTYLAAQLAILTEDQPNLVLIQPHHVLQSLPPQFQESLLDPLSLVLQNLQQSQNQQHQSPKAFKKNKTMSATSSNSSSPPPPPKAKSKAKSKLPPTAFVWSKEMREKQDEMLNQSRDTVQRQQQQQQLLLQEEGGGGKQPR